MVSKNTAHSSDLGNLKALQAIHIFSFLLLDLENPPSLYLIICSTKLWWHSEDHQKHHHLDVGKKHIYHIQQPIAKAILIKKEFGPPHREYSAWLIIFLCCCVKRQISPTQRSSLDSKLLQKALKWDIWAILLSSPEIFRALCACQITICLWQRGHYFLSQN